ncbi:MAG: galactose-1-phosphate uridylyltransferase, partial [Clostridiales bacterium]|nr:galactose-1-phosphate uridylyltransferase [Clostridiales bacterium]
GLAVLPARLKSEMDLMAEYILAGKDLRADEALEKHADWYDTFKDSYTFTEENVETILQDEIGKVFVKVLEDAGVYKCTPEGREAFQRFIGTL